MTKIAKMTKKAVKNLVEVLRNATIMGGVSGLAALVLAVWVMIDYFKMGCGFDKMCEMPESSEEVRDFSINQDIKFVMALVVVVPALLSILYFILGLSK